MNFIQVLNDLPKCDITDYIIYTIESYKQNQYPTLEELYESTFVLLESVIKEHQQQHKSFTCSLENCSLDDFKEYITSYNEQKPKQSRKKI
jgi:hypothetical protein